MRCRYETPVSKRCLGTKEIDPCPGYDKCERFQPDYKTNADHIRSMTDEELVEMFHGGGLCNYIQDNNRSFCEARAVCTNCVLEWLKQPYKEER